MTTPTGRITGTCSPCGVETTMPIRDLTIIVGLNGDAEYSITCAVCGTERPQYWTGIDTTTRLAFAQHAGAHIECVASVRRDLHTIADDFVHGRHGQIITTDDAMHRELDLWERAANPPAANA